MTNQPPTEEELSKWGRATHADCWHDRQSRLIAEVRRLREALAIEAEYHDYECPIWRIGKKHGPCNCPAKERAKHFAETGEYL